MNRMTFQVAISLVLMLFQGLSAQMSDEVLNKVSAPAGSVTPVYKAQEFAFDTIKGLTKKQLTDHYKLYQGYVNKLNEILALLSSADLSKADNVTYSQVRGLKIAQTYALNGMLYHELYFTNISNRYQPVEQEDEDEIVYEEDKSVAQPGPLTRALIEKNFTSLQRFKDDVLATAKSARGWSVTGILLKDGSVSNYLLDTHNEYVPAGVLPILVIDSYEHAYMIDFGIDRASYFKVVWDNINWAIVEQRVQDIQARYPELFPVQSQEEEDSSQLAVPA